MSLEVWGDGGDQDDNGYTQERVDEIVAEETARLRAALEKIKGGFINMGCLFKEPPDWHEAFNQLQTIAREALESSEYK